MAKSACWAREFKIWFLLTLLAANAFNQTFFITK